MFALLRLCVAVNSVQDIPGNSNRNGNSNSNGNGIRNASRGAKSKPKLTFAEQEALDEAKKWLYLVYKRLAFDM
jgi:hypothetical protein